MKSWVCPFLFLTCLANQAIGSGHIVAVYPQKYSISSINRDSYADTVNSLGGGHQLGQHNSYQIPQSPIYQQNEGGGYGMEMQGGWGWEGNSQSSKGGGSDLIGLIGLIGLKGLAGTIPFIKKAVAVFIALLPILIPLAILKLPLLLTPVFTLGFGRRSPTLFRAEAEEIAGKVDLIENFNQTSHFTNIQNASEANAFNGISGNELLGKGANNQCMERISCEGLLKSLPRLFLKAIGENSYIRKRRDLNKSNEPDEFNARKKDLAQTALNRLKNPHILTRTKPVTEDVVNTEEVCRQYKCPVLF